MLILRRKLGESFVIGDNVDITVLSVDASGNVNLGINAPKDVLILRSELKQAVEFNKDAAVAGSDSLAIEKLGMLLKGNAEK